MTKTLKRIIAALVLFIAIALYFSIDIKIENSESFTISYGETEYDISDATISFLGMDLSKYLKISDKVNIDVVADYKITYSLNFGIPIKWKSVKVSVIDDIAPTIILQDGSLIVSNMETPYDYNVNLIIDNYDKDLKLEVDDSEVDYTTEGVYTVYYKARDNSDNVSVASQQIIVDSKVSQDDFINYDFNSFDLPSLEYHDYALGRGDMLYYYFIGDSIIRDMGYYGVIDSWRVIATPCLGPFSVKHQTCTFKSVDTNKTALDILKEVNARGIVLSFGLCDIESGGFKSYFKDLKEFIDQIYVEIPDAEIVIASVLPVSTEVDEIKPKNSVINIYNYFLAKFAMENELDYVNVQEVLKDDQGNGSLEFYVHDGYHLNDVGQEAYISYFKHRLR